MKNKIKRIGIVLGAGVILLGATVVFSEPGTENDPLVSLSYIEKRMDQLKSYVDQKVSGTSTKPESAWVVVEVPAGKSIVCKDGTEIILRSGEAIAIASNLGGLTDVTAGHDLKMDQLITKNHLLIIPRDDGRGAYCNTISIFLVKGNYEIL